MESAHAGHVMSLAALQRQDPYINKLLDVTGQVALYNFNAKAHEWVCLPHHGFTIMNRLSTENLVEPINKDLEFQLQDPFLLYRNGNLGIYSIWFYEKKDCHRIAQLMVKFSQDNGAPEPRSIDILELLSKAKEEYQRAQTGDTDVATTSELSVKAERAHGTPQADKHSHMVKQITVEELFGSSLPKDPPLPPGPQQPAFNLHPSPVFQPLSPVSPLAPAPVTPQQQQQQQPPQPPGAFLGQEILNSLKADVHKPILAPSFLPSTLVPPHSFQEPMGKPLLPHNDTPTLVKPMAAVSMSPALSAAETSLLLSPSVFQQSISKAPPAAVVPPVHVHPQVHTAVLPTVHPQVHTAVVPTVHPQVHTAVHPTVHTAVHPTVHPAVHPTVHPTVHAEPSSSGDTQPSLCSKAQLQDTLVHLIKNDADFLSAIHDAYLQSLSKDLSNMKL
ncbi:hypothetical protein WMY93_027503 [Mugilogobius chulae]|uniref:5'-(N(7)-methylguanosine 5'-triphospho)-[mRNA] hydrolase n=1 Tax=Mugilogobius chulae TaxID=88201 RepID=A0AAW0N437_9GOBI